MNPRLWHTLHFLVYAFGISWLIAALFYSYAGGLDSPLVHYIGPAYMAGPLAAALIVQRRTEVPLRRTLGLSFRPNRWWLAAVLVPLVLMFGALGVSLLLPGTWFAPEPSALFERFCLLEPSGALGMTSQRIPPPVHPFWSGLRSGLFFGVTTGAVVAFGEEGGWRGFLLRELAPLGFWRSSLSIGVLWGLWHAPLVMQGLNYPGHPYLGIGMLTLFTALFAPVLAYVRLRARSVIPAALLHGTLNGIYSLPPLVVAGGSALTVGVFGLAGLLTLVAINVSLLLHDRMLAAKPIEQVLREEAELAEASSVDERPWPHRACRSAEGGGEEGYRAVPPRWHRGRHGNRGPARHGAEHCPGGRPVP